MKKNLYYREIYGRKNIIQALLFGFFQFISSYPKLLLEVFLRKNFGERYFNLASVLTTLVLFSFIPYILYNISTFTNAGLGREAEGILKSYASWYIFLALFLGFSYKRSMELRWDASLFNFERFSMSAGDINPFFKKIQIGSKTPSPRIIETVYEPGVFLLLGILLKLLGQPVGSLLIVCSIIYCISYLSAYSKGNEFVLDKIDEMIMNEELEDAFVRDEESDETRGVRFYTTKPGSEEMRRKVGESFYEQEEEKTFAR